MAISRIERMSYKLPTIALIAMLLYATGASADDPDPSIFSFSGYGTLGVVHSSEDNADFVGNFFHPNGAGYTRSWSANVDSRLGVQIDANFNDQLSAVVQVVSQQRYDNSYTPQIEWANVKYQFTPDFSVRLGRTAATTFMFSDSFLVGYSYLWLRPPQELYGSFPLTRKDGIDAVYRFHFGEVTNSLQASYGQTSLKFPGGGKVKGRHLFDVNNTVEYGPATVRIGYSSVRADLHSPGTDALFDGFTQFGNTLSAIPGLQSTGTQALSLSDKYRFEDTTISVITIGANYDPGPWLLMAEWARVNASSVVSDSTAWYVTGGYRIGKFTPYLTFAQLSTDKISERGISTAGLPPSLAQAAADLNGGLNATLSSFAAKQKTVSAGVRWDFMRNAALTLQYDHLNLGSGSNGRLGNIQPDFQPGGTINVFSATIDFVF